jgi:hypothetical protein
MNDTPPPASWSRNTWAAVVLAVLALQITGVYLFSPALEPGPRSTETRIAIHWLTDPARARKTLDALLLNDPTLLAVASPRGFSGAAWLRPQPQSYKASEWNDTGRPLLQSTQSLGRAFAPLASAGAPPVFDPARKLDTSVTGVTVVETPLRKASRLVIQGELANRPLVQSPAVRSWAHTDVLADSRVQVLVNDEGLVFSSRLAGSTVARNPAQRIADLHALELARTLRFAPVVRATGAGQLKDGTLVFQWHTTEPPTVAKE